MKFSTSRCRRNFLRLASRGFDKSVPPQTKMSPNQTEAKAGEFAAWYSTLRLAAWVTLSASESQSSITRTASINQRGSAAQLSSSWEPDPLSYHLRRAAGTFLALLTLLTVLFAQNNAHAQDNTDLEKRLQETEAALARLDNYTAIFHRIERVNGKPVPEQITFLKFKRPFKVYMRWINPFKGQESLYVQGANNKTGSQKRFRIRVRQ